MQDLASETSPRGLSQFGGAALVSALSIVRFDFSLSFLAAVLLTLAFPDFGYWPLGWVALTPLIVVSCRARSRLRAFLLGWFASSLFFYCSCYWLTYPMIHYGGIPAWIAFLLLLIPVLVVGAFAGTWSLMLSLVSRVSLLSALLLAPMLWVALEWARLELAGELWNALGYSQAYVPALIQTARWGGVYFVSFLMATTSAAVALPLIQRNRRSILIGTCMFGTIILVILLGYLTAKDSLGARMAHPLAAAKIIALQPNVPVDLDRSSDDTARLFTRHLEMSERALNPEATIPGSASNSMAQASAQTGNSPPASIPSILVWPESPMNFSYAYDSGFRRSVGHFAQTQHSSILFNSLEPAPDEGAYNAAMMIDADGKVVAQYDKIRLLPFGEYVPLPRWVPGASMIRGLVGDFTPGNRYSLFPLGPQPNSGKAGVFICFESAFPSIARRFAYDGADVLINISNDAYLGPTAVMRQHLANAIFRAVENGRPLVRVTNAGITVYISKDGEINDATAPFEPAVRVWTVPRVGSSKTFYTIHGDVFAFSCSAISFLCIVLITARVRFGFSRNI